MDGTRDSYLHANVDDIATQVPVKGTAFLPMLTEGRGDVMGGTHLAGERMELSLRCP